MSGVVVAGEALVDLVPGDGTLTPVPGGSSLNVAIGLGRLGTRVAYLGALSTDGFGRVLATQLDRAGVDHGLAEATDLPTTLAVVHVDDGGRATYGFYLDATSAVADPGPVALPDGAALHVSFGAIGPTQAPAGQRLVALLRAEAGRRLTCLDPNVRPSAIGTGEEAEARWRAALEDAVATVDLVKVSDEDLERVAPGVDVETVAARWATCGPALVVVTRGPDGAVAFGPAGRVAVPGVAVDVVDTVGAGDAFTAGLLDHLDAAGAASRGGLERLGAGGVRSALTSAVRVAALTCTRRGADPPTAEEVAAGPAPR